MSDSFDAFRTQLNQSRILFIEPQRGAAAKPVIDELTRIMAAALDESEPAAGMYGKHFCRCGAQSRDASRRLSSGSLTNSLAVHYLAFHRAEVPREELDKVRRLGPDQMDPTPEQLSAPRRRRY